MPYEVFARNGEYCVHKIDPDGQPVGDPLGCHATREAAQAQVAALYASEAKQLPEDETEALEAAVEALAEQVIDRVIEALPDALGEALQAGAPDDEDDEDEDEDEDAPDDDEDGDASAELLDALTSVIEAAVDEDDEDDEEKAAHKPAGAVAGAAFSKARQRSAAPDRPSWVTTLLRKLRGSLKTGATVLKGRRGARYMLLVTSNAYRDRDGETISRKALQADVDRHWHGGAYFSNEPLLFWHDDRLRIGDIVFGDVRGAFLIEVAKEARTPLAGVIWDHIEKHPGAWGASHRFEFGHQDRTRDGVFKRIRKQETSVLPREWAANPLTLGTVLGEKGMDKARDAYLDKLFAEEIGIDNASELLDRGIEHLMTALAERGYQHKARKQADDDVLFEDLVAALAEVDAAVQALRATVAELAQQREAQAEELKRLAKAVRLLKARQSTLPRSASRALETELTETELTQAAKQGEFEYDPFWKAPVKRRPSKRG